MAFPSLDEVVQQLRTIAEDESIVPDSKLVDLEVDSLDVMEWMFEIEGQAEMQIDEAIYDKEALETSTIRDLYDRIKQAATT